MAFGSLADYNGEIDLVFFEKIWESRRDTLAEEDQVILKGQLDNKRDKPSFRVMEILNPDKLPLPYREIHIRLQERAAAQEEELYPLRDYLMENPGSCSVYIHVPIQDGEAVIRTATQMLANQAHIDGILQYAGVAEVWGK